MLHFSHCQATITSDQSTALAVLHYTVSQTGTETIPKLQNNTQKLFLTNSSTYHSCPFLVSLNGPPRYHGVKPPAIIRNRENQEQAYIARLDQTTQHLKVKVLIRPKGTQQSALAPLSDSHIASASTSDCLIDATLCWFPGKPDRGSRIKNRGSGIYYLVLLFRSYVI